MHNVKAMLDHCNILPSSFYMIQQVLFFQFTVELQTFVVWRIVNIGQNIVDRLCKGWIEVSGMTQVVHRRLPA